MLSKLGYCSRSQAFALVKAKRVRVNGQLIQDPEWRTAIGRDRIEVDGKPVGPAEFIYLMLNKLRGLVTTTSDEHARATVYDCFAGTALPFLSPVGRLDKASEGLLLFTNDTTWASAITSPQSHVKKTYHVQLNRHADAALLSRIKHGVLDSEELLSAVKAEVLRTGDKTCWLEIVLDEGKNRHIRRLMQALDCEVLRLVRVAIGPLILGSLPKGQFRPLTPGEIAILRRAGKS
jgi:23S rRNA pseudouridine2605 synthase